jgi:hypothetical protein
MRRFGGSAANVRPRFRSWASPVSRLLARREWALIRTPRKRLAGQRQVRTFVSDLRSYQPQCASVANWNSGSISTKFALVLPPCLFHDARKAVPVPDVGFFTTNLNKGTAMSGQAAKITFHRDSLPDPHRALTCQCGFASNRASGEHDPLGFRQARQLADR